jgi:26S proteasome regulatory subunit N12
MYPILGINLLRFLSQNRIAEFHTALELIDADQIHTNAFIKHPIQLEQYMMEGSYNKVWNARSDVPAPEYTFFMDILMATIRNEIANTIEIAYPSLPISALGSLLFLKDSKDIQAFIQQHGWTVQNNVISFKSEVTGVQNIPNDKIIQQTLHYSRELEKIV